MEIQPETLLTSHQVGQLLQVNPSSVNKWVKQGRIRAFRTPGGHRRIRAIDLVAFLVAHEMPVPAQLEAAGRRRVLVVDDDPGQLKELGDKLEKYAEQIDPVFLNNSIDALLNIGLLKPHTVVLDAGIGDMDGLEVCRHLRANASLKDVRIVVASSKMQPKLEADARESGADLCVSKPIDAAALREFVIPSEVDHHAPNL